MTGSGGDVIRKLATNANADRVQQGGMQMPKGPMYQQVELIDVLPMSTSEPDGMKQQLPSREDLQTIIKRHPRIVAGYEVLLAHYLWLRKAALDVAEHWSAWIEQAGWENDAWDGFSDSIWQLEQIAKSVSVPNERSGNEEA